MENIDKFLGELPLFKGFSPGELQNLIEESQLKTIKPQEVIIHFGQPGSFLGVILEGEAEAVGPAEPGERQRLGLLQRGDFLGEMSLLTGEPTSADVVALEECKILLIPQDTFSAILAVNRDALQVMARTITHRLRSRQEDEKAKARVDDAWRSARDPYGLELSSTTPLKILVLNGGSSSLKYNFYDTAEPARNIEGMVEKIGSDRAVHICSIGKGKITEELGAVDYAKAFEAVIDLLTDSDKGVIGSLRELTAVGHRVVHGGDNYGNAVVVNEQVIEAIDKNSRLAPLHNPINLMLIKQCLRRMPKAPQVAVFDTGFHHKMPQQAALYGLPFDFYEKDHIRRYGFHGISHNFVALKAAAFSKTNFRKLKIITCHLGNGASVCAIDHGRSVDTSMGLTPLEGLIMGTRCGDLDPSVVIYLMREKGLSLEEVDQILNRQSGLQGLSGISGDLRELANAANRGDARAMLAIHVFCYRIRKYIGAYIAALGGLDALVFTGGIGAGSSWVRGLACQGLAYMNVIVDDIKNKTATPGPGAVADISGESSLVKVLVIPTDEGRMIARETIGALGRQNVARVIQSKKEKEIPIEVSAHHVHLSPQEVEALFGPGYELTHKADLSQPGQFACQETVNLLGPKGRVERVRVLGPYRRQSQVEISMTEEFKLGIKPPIRLSGDLTGSLGLALEGPKGACEIPHGVICALRHIHMSPQDALSFSLKDRDVVMVKVKGERTLIFGDTHVRVHPDFRLSMHIDTDEANAANIRTGMIGYIAGVQARS